MTHLQRIIRDMVAAKGSWNILVGTGSPCTQGTVKCLIKDGYACTYLGNSDNGCMVYAVSKPQ